MWDVEAMLAGVTNYLVKNETPATLRQTIRQQPPLNRLKEFSAEIRWLREVPYPDGAISSFSKVHSSYWYAPGQRTALHH